jgi:hypothetical protein
MNRVLRRPMFRMGGSTEGITSGLDMPRQNYQKAGSVNQFELNRLLANAEKIKPSALKVMLEGAKSRGQFDKKNTETEMQKTGDMVTSSSNLDDVIAMAQAQAKKYTPARDKTNFNDFLISLGLDLVSRPSSGNIFSDVATSAKAPFQQFLADKQSAAKRQRDRESQLFGNFLQAGLADRKFDRTANLEKLKESQELLTLYDKTAQENVIVKAGDVYANLENYGPAEQDKEGRTFEKLEVANLIEQKMSEIFELKAKENPTPDDQQAIIRAEEVLQYLQGNNKTNAFATALLKDPEYLSTLRSQIKKKLKTTDKYSGALTESQEVSLTQEIDNALQYYIENLSFPPELMLAKGGRVNYQMGGDVGMQQEQMPQMDFETLRARLPQEITDDIVRLISASPQALEDFATIQTQQDVNNFNMKYNVELILPAEA